ncbi:MAG: leucyl aminopeptidase [Gemmatimonadota bacterium]|nr:leucyl aminopeptidase [Gemmatimonadota bacterium]
MNATHAAPEDRARLIVRRLLAIQPGEQVALVCDPSSERVMVDALCAQILDAGAEFTVLTQPDRGTDRKNELTPVIQKALESADVLIGLTRSGGAPTYHHAVKKLYKAKTLRGMSMVMRTLENFTSGGALADYDALKEEGDRFAALWRTGSRIRITTPAGTDLSSTMAGEDVIVECGFATEMGLEAAFSDGEVSQMPNEGKASGRIVVDGPIAHLGGGEPVVLRVEEGRVVAVESEGTRSRALAKIVTEVPRADNIAEIGIGLNGACRRNGDFEEEKKARGLVHVAIGDNVFYGGTVRCPVHMDMVLYAPTVTIDDRVVVEAGEVVFA